MVRFPVLTAGGSFYVLCLVVSLCLAGDTRGQTKVALAQENGATQSTSNAEALARKDSNGAEWARMLAKLTGSAEEPQQPAKPSAQPKGPAKGKPAPGSAGTSNAQVEEWSKALESLGGSARPVAPAARPQPAGKPASAAASGTSSKPRPVAADPVAVHPAVAILQETGAAKPENANPQPPAANAATALTSKPASQASSAETAPERGSAPLPATAPTAAATAATPAASPAGKVEARPGAAPASPSPAPASSGQVESKPKATGLGPIWLEIQTATLSTRYRYVDNSSGVMTNNQLQHNEAFKARLKFGPHGNYSINAGMASGNNFTGGWNNTGVGTGDPYSNLFLKQLFLEARPVAGLEAQYGGLAFSRGDSTEITSYDNDAYLVGERISLKRPKDIFFDEITATYAFVGDLTQPDVNKRFYRLKQSNYHQFLVAKKLGKRGSLSADYTFAAGVETLRQAVKLNVKESRALDSILFENYQRVDVKPDYGFALYGERTLRKRYTLGGGFASIDRNYGGLNADRFNKGKRVYFSSKFVLTPEFSVSTFLMRAVWNGFAVTNRTRLDVIFTYDLLKSLQRTGAF